MSDELAIQPQIIQPKKDNSALYGTIGAGAGAVAGYYGIPALAGKKIASHDDIIKDAKDQVDLSTKYSKADSATIDEVKAAASEFKQAEAELAEAKKPVGDTSNPAIKKFQDKDAEINRKWQEAYDSKTGVSGKNDAFKNPPKVDKLTVEQLPGDMTPDKAKSLYTKKLKELERANSAFEGSKEITDIVSKKTKFETELNKYLDAQFRAYGSKSDDELADIFAEKTTGRKAKPTAQYQAALDAAEKFIPELPEVDKKKVNGAYLKKNIKLEDAKSIGEIVEKGEYVDPKKYVEHTYTTYGESGITQTRIQIENEKHRR